MFTVRSSPLIDEGLEFIIWDGAEWVELRLEEEGLACSKKALMKILREKHPIHNLMLDFVVEFTYLLKTHLHAVVVLRMLHHQAVRQDQQISRLTGIVREDRRGRKANRSQNSDGTEGGTVEKKSAGQEVLKC